MNGLVINGLFQLDLIAVGLNEANLIKWLNKNTCTVIHDFVFFNKTEVTEVFCFFLLEVLVKLHNSYLKNQILSIII